MPGEWTKDQPNEIKFVMIDSNGNEVTGLGSSFTLLISKPGDEALVAGAGTKSEIGDGFYRYLSTAEEADTLGIVAITVSGAGAIQQNLIYEVEDPELTAKNVWDAPIRTLTSPTGQTSGPTVVPATPWFPP